MRPVRRVGASGYRGVYPSGARFRARIQIDGKLVRMGLFDTAEEAARAYDAKAREMGKPEAHLNFPVGS